MPFNSVWGLVKSRHPGQKVVVKGGNFYLDGSTKKLKVPEHYECPNCGIVEGEPLVEHYRNSQVDWALRQGFDGYLNYCHVCRELLDVHKVGGS